MTLHSMIAGTAAGFALGLPLLFALPAHAAVQVSNTTLINQGFVVSNSDLTQTSIASIQTTGVLNTFGTAGAVVLNDGNFGGLGPIYGDAAVTGAGSSITFNFVSPRNIAEIATYSGWEIYRGGQSYTVSYSTASNPSTFVNLASVFNNATSPGNVSTRAIITDTTGVLASNVTSMRFAFNGNLQFGHPAYREIDIFAAQAQTPAIPEPATWAMMIAGFGLVGGMVRRRQVAVLS